MNKQLNILLAAIVLAVAACSDDKTDDTIKGIASVELNDTLVALHYYDNTYVLADEYRAGLTDSARVYFCINSTQRLADTASIFNANVRELSADLRTPIVYRTANLLSDTAICVPTDMHITRDFRHLDFFNISVHYATLPNNDDKTYLVQCSTEQEASTDSLVVLWLRHSQLRSDSTLYIEHNTISVPLNILIPPDSLQRERIYLKVKMLAEGGDTIVNDYIYSFVNIEPYY